MSIICCIFVSEKETNKSYKIMVQNEAYKNDRIITVDWDTDGENVELPKEILVPGFISDDEVSDYLSDTYGFCVNSWYEI